MPEYLSDNSLGRENRRPFKGSAGSDLVYTSPEDVYYRNMDAISSRLAKVESMVPLIEQMAPEVRRMAVFLDHTAPNLATKTQVEQVRDSVEVATAKLVAKMDLLATSAALSEVKNEVTVVSTRLEAKAPSTDLASVATELRAKATSAEVAALNAKISTIAALFGAAGAIIAIVKGFIWLAAQG